MQLPQNEQYDFAAQPRVVKARSKYRDPQEDPKYNDFNYSTNAHQLPLFSI